MLSNSQRILQLKYQISKSCRWTLALRFLSSSRSEGGAWAKFDSDSPPPETKWRRCFLETVILIFRSFSTRSQKNSNKTCAASVLMVKICYVLIFRQDWTTIPISNKLELTKMQCFGCKKLSFGSHKSCSHSLNDAS